MSYDSRAYDKNNDDVGFGPDPVVVLVVTGTHDVSRFVNLLNGGVPVIEQYELAKQITHQVNRARGGRAALSLLRQHGGPDLLERVVPAPSRHVDLTDRELTILRGIASGETSKTLGEVLYLNERTVKNHKSKLFAKLGVSTSGQAVAIGYDLGLLGGAR